MTQVVDGIQHAAQHFAAFIQVMQISAGEILAINPLCSVDLISSQSISTFEKKNQIEFPKELKKYQEQAYLTTLCNL